MTTEEAAAHALCDALDRDELMNLAYEMESSSSHMLEKIAGHINDIEKRD